MSLSSAEAGESCLTARLSVASTPGRRTSIGGMPIQVDDLTKKGGKIDHVILFSKPSSLIENFDLMDFFEEETDLYISALI